MGYSPQMALKIKIMMINQQIWGQFSDKTNSKMRCAFGNFTMRAMLATKEIHQLCTGFTSGKLGVTTVASTEMSEIS